MEPELSLRIALTRRSIGGLLAAALLGLLPARLGSQGDPAHAVSFTTYFPAPVGAFSELVVNGAGDIQLARDSGGLGIGNLGAGASAPNAVAVIVGQASFGSNFAAQGAEVINLSNGTGFPPGVPVQSGLSMDNRSGGARWVIYANQSGPRQMLWFWNSNYGDAFGIDATSNGGLRACTWNGGGCPGNKISMFRGTGGSGNAMWNCNGNNGGYCPPPAVGASWHLCCNIR